MTNLLDACSAPRRCVLKNSSYSKALKEELLKACNEILAMTNSQLEFLMCELSKVIDTARTAQRYGLQL